MTTKLELFTILTLPRNGISLQTGRNHQSNRCQRRQIEKIKNTTAVSFFFLFSAPALLAVRGSPLTARLSFDRSKNDRKRKRLLAVYSTLYFDFYLMIIANITTIQHIFKHWEKSPLNCLSLCLSK